MGGRTSKAKGKTGERRLRDYLKTSGWTLADKETQGLAGDDLFAEAPKSFGHLPRYYSVECKHTKIPSIAWIKQAKEQAKARAQAIALELQNPRSMASRLGITFDEHDWLLVWLPSGWFNADQALVVYPHPNGRSLRFALWDGFATKETA